MSGEVSPAGRAPRVTPQLVRALVAEQFGEDVGELPLRHVATGWDNDVYRLGDRLAIRLPRHRKAAQLIEVEATWLPRLAPVVPVATPVPVFVGAPGPGFAWPWSVVPWLPGTVMAQEPVADRTRYAAALADTLVSLHQPAPADAPANPYRGTTLAVRAATAPIDWTSAQRHGGHAASRRLRDRWEEGLAAPPWPEAPVWLHGDPHPFNVLVDSGRLIGLIDWGDLATGDPASDLASAWFTFDTAGQSVFRDRIDATGGVDAAVWVRARAWGVALTMARLAKPAADPRQHPVTAQMFAELAR